MSSLTATSSVFFDLESVVRQQIEEQEAENRKDLQDREIELRIVKEKTSLNEKLIEELRPLCEELPPDALDPVTMEPFEMPLVTRCSHTFNWKTVVDLIEHTGGNEVLKAQQGLPCPVCKWKMCPKTDTFSSVSILGMTNIFKKISEVFKKYADS